MKVKKILALIVFASAYSCTQQVAYVTIEGQALGTFYHITYSDNQQRNFQPEIDSLLNAFNSSLSAYSKESLLSKVNRNEEVEIDSFFIVSFNRSKEIYEMSNGAFDISGAPIFSAWKFGPSDGGERHVPDAAVIDSLLDVVGLDKIWLEGSRVVKSDPRIILNMNSIAKGYSSDVVAEYLDSKEIENYLVEIGGEIRMKGKNIEGGSWRIAIDKPIDGNLMLGSEIQVVLQLTDKGLATSANNRQFFIENGKKYGHTIDPRTGYPVIQSLLSATVVADDCMTADAVATALMVMGLEESIKFLAKYPEIDAYLIYDDSGEFAVYTTPGMEKYISE
ncbi:MAG: FAD:protein FMN transferase [Prevotellaceae bacterium]|jgi:thiamine biosynthesis lipoprotein|nr:FAD:protein FMN transferase [Prevotellaceae bacterium]